MPADSVASLGTPVIVTDSDAFVSTSAVPMFSAIELSSLTCSVSLASVSVGASMVPVMTIVTG